MECSFLIPFDFSHFARQVCRNRFSCTISGMIPPRLPRDPSQPVRTRRFTEILSTILTSLLARGEITNVGNSQVPAYAVQGNLAAGGGLYYNAGQLSIKLAPSANGVLTLGNDGLGVGNIVQRIGNGTVNITGNVTLVGNGVSIVANAINNNITLSANSSAGGVGNIGNGTANATGNVTLTGNGITFSITGNTVLGTVVGSGGGGGGTGLDPISVIYPPFATVGDDDEFNDNVFSGWTTVENAGVPAAIPTLTEMNNVISINLPGGDSAANLHAYVKPRTIVAGNYVEIAFAGMGRAQNYNICGVLMSDGATFGSGNQVLFYYSPNEQKWALLKTTGFNNQVDFNGFDAQQQAQNPAQFLRLTFGGTNSFSGLVSPDGVSWANVTGNIAETITPTHAGFFATTWGGSLPFVWSVRYCKLR